MGLKMQKKEKKKKMGFKNQQKFNNWGKNAKKKKKMKYKKTCFWIWTQDHQLRTPALN